MSAAPPRETAAGPVGVLITFEGGEGSGKSTQIDLLAGWLRGRGHEVVVAREPGTTAVGEMVRRILLEAAPDQLAPEAELALFISARAQLTEEVIRPALAAAQIVLIDRYGDSSLAYQGYGRGIEPARVAEMNRWATRGLVPELTVLIDVPVAAGPERRGGRAPDRLERAGIDFHERVREGYRQIVRNEQERFFVIEGRRSIDDIQQAIRSRVEQLLTARMLRRTDPE